MQVPPRSEDAPARAHALRTLGLTPGASPTNIKAAYRRLARQFHPDFAGAAERSRFEEIHHAYALLTKPAPARTTWPDPSAAAEAFFRDLGSTFVSKGSTHARSYVAEKLASGGRIARSAASLVDAVLEEVEATIQQEFRRTP